MALVLADRVKETTATTGTATYTLLGAVNGFETFASVGDGNTTYYACVDGTDFEVGVGTYTASGTTLARTTILQSSNSDNAVSWSSGTKTIFCTQPAEKAVFLDASGNIATFNGSNLTNVDATTLDGVDSGSFLRSDAFDVKTAGNLVFNDNVQLNIGTGSDLDFRHDGTDSFIEHSSSDTSSLYIRNNNITTNTTDGIAIETYDSGTLRHYVHITNNSGVSLGSFGADKLVVSTIGTYFNQDIFLNGDSREIHFRDTSAGDFDIILDAAQVTGSDKTITLPNATGTVLLADGDGSSLTNVNATTLDNLDSTQFLRSDQSDTITGDLTLISTDSSAADDPTFVLYRNSASPATSDEIGHIIFRGNNSVGGETADYAVISTKITGSTNNLEHGELNINVLRTGSSIEVASFNYAEVRFKQPVKLDGNSTDLFFDKGTYTTKLTSTNPSAQNQIITLPDASGTVLLNESGILNLTNSGAQSELRLFCESSNAHYASIKAPAHADFGGNITLTLPATTGTVLSTANADVATTTTSASDVDHVLVNDGGVLKKITTSDLGIGSGGGSYGNSSVDTHLNQSTANANEVLSWNGSDYDWVAQSSGGGGGGITTGKAIAMAMIFG